MIGLDSVFDGNKNKKFNVAVTLISVLTRFYKYHYELIKL